MIKIPEFYSFIELRDFILKFLVSFIPGFLLKYFRFTRIKDYFFSFSTSTISRPL